MVIAPSLKPSLNFLIVSGLNARSWVRYARAAEFSMEALGYFSITVRSMVFSGVFLEDSAATLSGVVWRQIRGMYRDFSSCFLNHSLLLKYHFCPIKSGSKMIFKIFRYVGYINFFALRNQRPWVRLPHRPPPHPTKRRIAQRA